MASHSSPDSVLVDAQPSSSAAASTSTNSLNLNFDKRKAEPHSGTHSRAKRNRYVSLACNECKRRKIKCNGQLPCQRCGHLNLECLYAPNCCSKSFKDSDEFRSMKERIETLQDQVNTLFANINELYRKTETQSFEQSNSHYNNNDNNNNTNNNRDHSRSLSISHQSGFESQHAGGGPTPALPLPRPKLPRFHGPTSTAFNFDLAKSSLQTMGITPTGEGTQELFMTRDATPVEPLPLQSQQQPQPQQMLTFPQLSVHPSKDPLWALKGEEVVRLCRVYEEEIGIMYPMLDIEKVIAQAKLLYRFIDAAERTGFTSRSEPGSDCLNDDNTCILKLILAVTMTVEGHGQCALGSRFYVGVKDKIEAKLWQPADVKTIKMLALMAAYHFHTDDDLMAYRFAGYAARMCLELGLHRRDALLKSFPDEEEAASVIKLFWSIYSLDRRWAFGAGLPFVIQDEDIDSSLPRPDDTVPYLKTMVSYCRIASKVWYSGVGSAGATTIKRDIMGFLDYQIVQWMKDIPEGLKFYSFDNLRNGEQVSRGLRRLRILLYIRGNHLRIHIYRPVLHSTTNIMENMADAQTVVDIAKDSIRVLTQLNQVTDIYRAQQALFNYFLVGALVILLLAVCHAPTEFNRQVRDEFYMALDLVKGFSTKSYVSKRLWKMIKGLRGIGEKLGLLSRPDSADAHSTAAVAMAGLAGHPMDALSVYNGLNVHGELGSSPQNGQQMSNELTSLFEAVGGYAGNILAQSSVTGAEGINGELVGGGGQGGHGEMANAGEMQSYALGSEGEFLRIMRDVF
ncbi:hypothetical protein AJ80_01288 [Polytolypa hystricis UAMH7299]|uniref:Zn(2)-C6 fungal-type domain-containing protein n=1 Tax=Polytolypa hystricis (strain UAMH7299) TaxID=1447883 RepID=A0A2B7Z193_POLH7|nr:hypothetical protein AJ80_01288 [Polytolypa hystricis UAMH7299]